MSNDRLDVKQLPLDFSVRDMAYSHLSLVINNAAQSTVTQVTQNLEPNSPEITRIIRDLGKTLTW